jgi:hypothetical protein
MAPFFFYSRELPFLLFTWSPKLGTRELALMFPVRLLRVILAFLKVLKCSPSSMLFSIFLVLQLSLTSPQLFFHSTGSGVLVFSTSRSTEKRLFSYYLLRLDRSIDVGSTCLYHIARTVLVLLYSVLYTAVSLPDNDIILEPKSK